MKAGVLHGAAREFEPPRRAAQSLANRLELDRSLRTAVRCTHARCSAERKVSENIT